MSTSDDDWETADLAPVKPKPTAKQAPLPNTNATPANLSAGAASFQPNASAPAFTPSASLSAGGSAYTSINTAAKSSHVNAEAGPSRPPVRLASRPNGRTNDNSSSPGGLPAIGSLSLADGDTSASQAGATKVLMLKRNEGGVSSRDKRAVWSPAAAAAPVGGSVRGSSQHFPALGAPVGATGGEGEGEGETEEGGDDWFQAGRPVTNRQIWDNANASSRPTIINSPQILPTPGVTILRRSAATGAGGQVRTGSTSGTQTPPKTIEEREEEYRLARERIFGPGSSGGGGGTGSSASVGSSATAAGTGEAQSEKEKEKEREKGGRSKSRNKSARSSPAPSPPLGPTPSQISSTTAAVNSTSTSTSTGIGNGRSRSGNGDRRRGPAHSGGAMPILTPPHPGSSGTYSPRGQGQYGQAPLQAQIQSQPGLVRQPRGPGEGPGFAAGFALQHQGAYGYGYVEHGPGQGYGGGDGAGYQYYGSVDGQQGAVGYGYLGSDGYSNSGTGGYENAQGQGWQQ